MRILSIASEYFKSTHLSQSTNLIFYHHGEDKLYVYVPPDQATAHCFLKNKELSKKISRISLRR